MKNRFYYRDGRKFEVVSLKHLTPNNSSARQRDKKKWKTVATVRDSFNGVTATGVSWCSKRDNPNRKIGREAAIGRAIARLSPLKQAAQA